MSPRRTLIPSREAAKVAGVAHATWRGYVSRGQAPKSVKTEGLVSYYDLAEVERWKANRAGQGARTDIAAGRTKPPTAAPERLAAIRAVLRRKDVPEHLRVVGQLRLKYPKATIAQLAELHDPPVTRDTLHSRHRRLLLLADEPVAKPAPSKAKAARNGAATRRKAKTDAAP